MYANIRAQIIASPRWFMELGFYALIGCEEKNAKQETKTLKSLPAIDFQRPRSIFWPYGMMGLLSNSDYKFFFSLAAITLIAAAVCQRTETKKTPKQPPRH